MRIWKLLQGTSESEILKSKVEIYSIYACWIIVLSTLWEKVLRISQYLIDDAIAKLYVT